MPPAAPPKSNPKPKRKIKPAGWVVIVLLLGGGLWWAYTKLAPLLAARPEPVAVHEPPAAPPKAPDHPAAAPPPPVVRQPTPAPSAVLSKSLFPAGLTSLPPPAPTLPPIALPPLATVRSSAEGIRSAASEAEAIRWVAQGQDIAIVSVAALASAPDAISKGVKAVWYLGSWPQEAALEPSCDAAKLRQLKLGAVRFSLAHYNLLATLAGEALPDILLVDGEQTLVQSYTQGDVTGGEAPLEKRAGIDTAACHALRESAFAFVVIRREGQKLSPAELSAVVALTPHPITGGDTVAAFFSGEGKQESPFEQVFNSAAKVWAMTQHVPQSVNGAAAVDRSFLEVPPAPKAELAPAPAAKQEATPEATPAPVAGATRPAAPAYGYPSWLDR